MKSLGIIGLGYVGNAVKNAYKSKQYDLVCVDIDKTKSTHNFDDLFSTDAIFICVPSPASEDGSCDASILINTLDKLTNYNKLIISKTTATPDIYETLSNKFPNLVHIPEFLTANNSINDYADEIDNIIGGDLLRQEFIVQAMELTRLGQLKLRSSYISSCKEAAFVKYVENSFLATKVVFMNEMALLAEKCNLNWNNVVGLLQKDPRVGLSHCKVPGPDGLYGFGGHCFPKDTSAWLQFANKLGIKLTLLEQAVIINKDLRKE
jgi:UDPglucose 6-dehydrogenase